MLEKIKSETQPLKKIEAKKSVVEDKHPEVKNPGNKKLSYNQKRLLEVLPMEIEQIEKRIAEIEVLLSDADLYARDPDAFNNLSTELLEKQKAKEDKENKWLEIQMLKEELEGL